MARRRKQMLKNLEKYEKIDALADELLRQVEQLGDLENESKQLQDLGNALEKLAGYSDYRSMFLLKSIIAEVLHFKKKDLLSKSFFVKQRIIVAYVVEITFSDTLTWFLKRKGKPYRLITVVIHQFAV